MEPGFANGRAEEGKNLFSFRSIKRERNVVRRVADDLLIRIVGRPTSEKTKTADPNLPRLTWLPKICVPRASDNRVIGRDIDYFRRPGAFGAMQRKVFFSGP